MDEAQDCVVDIAEAEKPGAAEKSGKGPAPAGQNRSSSLHRKSGSKAFAVLSKRIPFKNVLEAYDSLPRVSQALLIVSAAEAALMVAANTVTLSVHTDDGVQLVVGLLVGSVWMTYFAYDALVTENSFELVVACLVGCYVVVMRIVFYGVNNDGINAFSTAVWNVALVLQAATMILAYLVYRNFGWRILQRLNVDFRFRGAAEYRTLAMSQNLFSAALKLDWLFEVMLVVTITCSAANLYSHEYVMEGWTSGMLAVSFVGLGVNTSLACCAWLVVNRLYRASASAAWHRLTRHAVWLDVLMPLSFAQPILAIVIAVYAHTNGQQQSNITIVAALFIVTRLVVWFYMHRVIWAAKAVERIATDPEEEDASTHPAHSGVHPELEALVRGAWLGSPLPHAPRRKQFFQLSADASTLRWSWRGFLRTYYIDELIASKSGLTLTLVTTVTKDLILKFPDEDSFWVWEKGLQRAAAMQMAVGVEALPAPAGLEPSASLSLSSSLAQMAPRRLLKVLGVRVRRPSGPHLARLATAATGESALDSAYTPSTATSQAPSFGSTPTASATAPGAAAALPPLPPSSATAPAAPSQSGPAGAGAAATEAHSRESFTFGAAPQPPGAAAAESTLPLVWSFRRRPPLDTAGGRIAAYTGSSVLAPQPPGPGISPFATTAYPGAAPQEAEEGTPKGHKRGVSFSQQVEASTGSVADLLVQFLSRPSARSQAAASQAASTASRQDSSASAGRPEVLEVDLQSILDQIPAQVLAHATDVEIVDADELQLGRLLGIGAQGKVYAAWWRQKPVAVKICPLKRTALEEAKMHIAVGIDPSVVHIKALCQSGPQLCIVMEYFPRGTLHSMIHHTSDQWEARKLLRIALSIARAMQYLHTRDPPVLHRDLKPANIFVGPKQKMKLGDFGMARFLTISNQQGGVRQTKLDRALTLDILGTAQYTAPELLQADFDEGTMAVDAYLALDVYSYGVTLWEMLSKRHPHEGVGAFQLQAFSMLDPSMLDLGPIKFPSGLDPTELRVLQGLARVSTQCTALQTRARPSAQQVVCSLEAIVQREYDLDGYASPRSARAAPAPGRQPFAEVNNRDEPPENESPRKRAKRSAAGGLA